MKTLKPIQSRNNQTINNSLTLKNQKVMKTKKYSISMKALAAVVFTFAFSAFLNAQFVPPSPVFGTQTAEEVRATTSVTYDLSGTHTAGDTYRWAVRGGVITGGTPVGPDSSILGWTADIPLITVTWNTDITGTPIGSAPGEVIVQKRAGGTCASELQVLGITMWNPETANLNVGGLLTEICSGDGLGFTVPANLTGSPDPVITNFGFSVDYLWSVPTGSLETLIGGVVDGVTGSVPDNDELAQIPLPDGLVNTGAGDATFTLTLTAMQDDFNGTGDVSASVTYSIIVHQTPATGPINSTPAGLTR
jgi:hypothetical protein